MTDILTGIGILIFFVILGYLSRFFLEKYLKKSDKIHLYLNRGLFIFLVISITYICIKIINNLIIYYGSKNETLEPITSLGQKVVQVLILFIGIIMVLDDFVSQYLVQHKLRKSIFYRFKQEGIEIPFPIQIVYLKQEGNKHRSSN